jgi:hypothetical protein
MREDIMNISKTSWDDTPIRSPGELRTLILKLKKSVASGEMQQCWPADAPFVTEIKVSDVNENGPWPADYIEWYFLSASDMKRYKLSAETYHGAGGRWAQVG